MNKSVSESCENLMKEMEGIILIMLEFNGENHHRLNMLSTWGDYEVLNPQQGHGGHMHN